MASPSLRLIKSWVFWLLVVVAVGALVFFLPPILTPVGWLSAYIDQSRGHDEYKIWGHPCDWRTIRYSQLLNERYGVEGRLVGGCFYDPWQSSIEIGYNEVAKPRLIEKHGKDIFKECFQQALVEVPVPPDQ